jgi:uncharacterized protein YprB with RNaseH-like and TPR domain
MYGAARALDHPKPLAAPAGFSQGVNRLGNVYYRDEYFPLDHLHGKLALQEALDLHPDFLDRLSDGIVQADLRDAAYLDIETTGLSGGGGSCAFLVGVGTFDGLAFRVRQFFLANPSGEAAMLTGLAETVERCNAFVTYNGKSFDLPQLADRYAIARLLPGGDGLPHIDLLHITRRLYGRSMGSCRLSDVEQRLLGFKRHEDMPSAAIPGAYSSSLTHASVRRLHSVFEHNTLDVLSLPAALAYLSRVAGEFCEMTPDLHLALGRWDESRSRDASAVQHYRQARELDANGDEGGEAACRLARLYRHQHDWERCFELWHDETAQATSRVRLVRAFIELAKLYEQRLSDRDEALALCTHALGIVQDSPPSIFVTTRPRLEKQIERLRSRLAR